MQPNPLLIDLFQAYFDSRSNKRNTINALRFELHYEQNLLQLYQELVDRKYEVRRSVCFINFKPVQREIFAADFRDRVIHHLLYNYLAPIFEPSFIKDSYSCRVGKGTHYGIQCMQRFMRTCSQNYQEEAYILKIDILGYFMCMDRALLYAMIQRKLENYQQSISFDHTLVNYLLEKVIFNDPTRNCVVKGRRKDWEGLPPSKSLFSAAPGKGLPIGNLTSQFFGNIYLNGLDHFIKEQLQIKYYGRYVDDCVLMHPDKAYLKACLPQIKTYLEEELTLEIHPRKIYLQHYAKGVSFLGTYIKPYRTYIGKRTKHHFYQAIQDWNAYLVERSHKLTEQELDRFIASINFYLGILKHYKTYRLRKKLLFSLNGYYWNYVYICGGYTKLAKKRKRMKKQRYYN